MNILINLGSIRTLAQITSLCQDLLYKFQDRREVKAHRAAELEKQKKKSKKVKNHGNEGCQNQPQIPKKGKKGK